MLRRFSRENRLNFATGMFGPEHSASFTIVQRTGSNGQRRVLDYSPAWTQGRGHLAASGGALRLEVPAQVKDVQRLGRQPGCESDSGKPRRKAGCEQSPLLLSSPIV